MSDSSLSPDSRGVYDHEGLFMSEKPSPKKISINYKASLNPLGAEMYSYKRVHKDQKVDLKQMRNKIRNLKVQEEKMKIKNRVQN